MKRRISKADFEALSPEMKTVYVADGDGYKLPLIDDDDPDALRRARDREREDAKGLRQQLATAQEKVTAIQEKLDVLQTDPARKAGDIATLEASWKAKLTAKEEELNKVIVSQKAFIEKTLISEAVNKVAGAVTANPQNANLLRPHIESRFEVVHDGESTSVKIKDKDGHISAMNFEELQKEIIANPDFGSIVVASRASGGGAAGHSPNSNGGAGKKLMDMSETERVALYRANPEDYRRRREAEA